MIKLDIEEYCQQCPEFEPDVEKNDKRETLYTNDLFAGGLAYHTIGEHETVVRCEHRRKCECLKNHIDQESKKKEKSNE